MTPNTQLVALGLLLLTFVLTWLWTPPLLRLLHHLGMGRSIREDVPERHRAKMGTVTMGGCHHAGLWPAGCGGRLAGHPTRAGLAGPNEVHRAGDFRPGGGVLAAPHLRRATPVPAGHPRAHPRGVVVLAPGRVHHRGFVQRGASWPWASWACSIRSSRWPNSVSCLRAACWVSSGSTSIPPRSSWAIRVPWPWALPWAWWP